MALRSVTAPMTSTTAGGDRPPVSCLQGRQSSCREISWMVITSKVRVDLSRQGREFADRLHKHPVITPTESPG